MNPDIPKPSGPLLGGDHLINLYYLNELYGKIAGHVSGRIGDYLKTEIPITSGIWGGTYLIADDRGKCMRRVWRLYSIVNLPQNTPLDEHANMEKLIGFYCEAFRRAFEPYEIDLALKMWGGLLPFSCKLKPSFTLHMEDSKNRVKWLRAFFVWNQAAWEESVIYDAVRIVKEYKQYFDLDRGMTSKPASDLKFILQDIIIIYRTLERACHPDFIEHAEPVVRKLVDHFMEGLFDEVLIRELYEMVFTNALIYGYEQALERPFAKAGLDIRAVEHWPVKAINRVPDELKQKLVPPIQALFAKFRANLADSAALHMA
ncbi:MAG: hypothetical protein HY580_00440 [Nitrospinae bacterium]|nr:hypothetical protein [Nitrospinota bacterium]